MVGARWGENPRTAAQRSLSSPRPLNSAGKDDCCSCRVLFGISQVAAADKSGARSAEVCTCSCLGGWEGC